MRAAARPSALLPLALLLALSCEKSGGAPPASSAPSIFMTAGGVEMVRIPAGSFEMGSRNGKEDEAPVHAVSIDAFLMDRTEVTQDQFARMRLSDPSHFKGPQNPVEQITWPQAARYCNARSRAEGLEPCYDAETGACRFEASGYRLPTEAEWEYACRAGTGQAYSFGSDPRTLGDYAWFADNASKKTHPVGQKKPNPWGIFDMHGNVAEWCNDVYDKQYYAKTPAKNPRGPAEGDPYVLRGGAWDSSADAVRSSRRVGEDPGFQDACFARDAIGFRCVRRASDGAAAPAPAGGAAEPAPTPPGEQGRARPSPPTGFVYQKLYLEHRTGDGFPESPRRLEAIVQRLAAKELMARLLLLPPLAAPAEWITAVHSVDYVERVRKACAGCGDGIGLLDSPDVPISSRSYEAAAAAVGGVLAAVDAVMEGRVRNAFCAVRPPGHHARKDQAMGFCLFNNVAIGARYIQKKHRLSKVLIVDWDVHHGNGTQEAFYSDPSVLYFSTHQSPFYPGTGGADETGEGAGAGTTINVPLPAGSGDGAFKKAYEEKLKPAALAFRPDFVLVSAGFDAHRDDPIGGLAATPEGYAELTRIVRGIAEACCAGRLVSVLEGGYDLAGLADSAEAHVRALMD